MDKLNIISVPILLHVNFGSNFGSRFRRISFGTFPNFVFDYSGITTTVGTFLS